MQNLNCVMLQSLDQLLLLLEYRGLHSGNGVVRLLVAHLMRQEGREAKVATVQSLSQERDGRGDSGRILATLNV